MELGQSYYVLANALHESDKLINSPIGQFVALEVTPGTLFIISDKQDQHQDYGMD